MGDVRVGSEERVGDSRTRSKQSARPGIQSLAGEAHPSSVAGVLALQRVAGNRAVVRRLEDGAAGRSRPPRPAKPVPPTPPEIADQAADGGLGRLQDAVVAAGAAYLVTHIEGTKHLGRSFGASQRTAVVKARAQADYMAGILARTAALELRDGRGMYGTAAIGDDDHLLVRQRAAAKGSSLEDTIKALQSVI